MEEHQKPAEKKKSLLKCTGTVLAVILFVRYVLPLLLPFVLAYLLSELLTPLAERLKKYLKIPVSVGGAVLILAALLLLGTGLFFFLRLLCRQLLYFWSNLEGFREEFRCSAQRICSCMDRFLRLECGTSASLWQKVLPKAEKLLYEDTLTALTKNRGAIVRFFVGLFTEGFVTFVAAILFLGYRQKQKKSGKQDAVLAWADKIRRRLSAAGAAYLKTELLLTLLVALVCSVCFFFVKREYALVLGILVAVLDAFPVIGSGCVLVPWSLLSLVFGHPGRAGILFAAYLVCILIREFLEPRLLGDKIGIPPLYTLMAVYLGIKLFGICGVLLGPLCLVILRYETE